MSEDWPDIPTDRHSPVGDPVIRGDESITGQSPSEAAHFDPSDPNSIETAAETVQRFANEPGANIDPLFMLRGAAACAALVRAEGSYKAATERAGEGVTITFVRKWARVHDLPRPIRIHVARGEIAPTAAKHIARVAGEARYQLAWAVLDADLTVREVREIASEINDGLTVDEALTNRGKAFGELNVSLPTGTYRRLRQDAALNGASVDTIVAEALSAYLEE